jgi:HEAT repeat protein
MDDVRALAVLLAMLTDEHFMVRWSAVDALVELGRRYPLESKELHVVFQLRNCLSDDYEPVRKAAAKAFQ